MQIAIPLFDRFTALDAVGPYEVLSRLPDAEVVFAAAERRVVRTDTGALGIEADARFAELTAPDVLLVPGGIGTRTALADEELLAWMRGVHERSRWTTSVCTGSLVLAAAGILDRVEATTHWLAMDLLEELGARPVRQRFVERGKIVTAAGVSAGIDMALLLAERVAGAEVAQSIQLGIEYDPAPPFDAGSPAKAPEQVVALARAGQRAEEASA